MCLSWEKVDLSHDGSPTWSVHQMSVHLRDGLPVGLGRGKHPLGVGWVSLGQVRLG